MALISDILAFFQLVATHPGIGHAPAADPPVDRFYGFNFEEFETKSKSTPNFFPCLGLSDSPHSGLQGSYTATDTSITSITGINVLVLDSVKMGDYDAEYELYDRLKPVCDDLINYIQWRVAQGPLSTYRFLDVIDLSSMNLVRVGPKGTAKAYGWKISIAFRQRGINQNTNPLNTILG